MKPRSLILTGIIFFLLQACSNTKNITLPVSPASVQKAIDSSTWLFTPTYIKPQYSRSRVAGPGYTFSCRDHKLVVYLPYYGRAYGGADVLSGRGPLDFSSANYILQQQNSKPGEWHFIIQPKDYSEVQSFSFVVFDNGTASVNVILTNHSAVSYDGNFAPLQ